MKLYDGSIILFLIILAFFGKAVYTVDKATDGGREPIHKERLLEELSPITSANHERYNN